MITKELIGRRLLRIAFLMLMVWLVLLATSCGGKKKIVQSSEYSTEIAKVERVNELVEKDVEKSTETATGTEKTAEKELENFQAEIDDPTKRASITKKEKDGEITWNLENIKNFNSGKEKSKEQLKDTATSDFLIIGKSKIGKQSESELGTKASGSGRNVDLKAQRTSTFVTIGIGLGIFCVLILLFLFIYFRIKRGKEKKL